MVDPATQERVKRLLDAVRQNPRELPLAELAAISQAPVDVSIDRTGDSDVAFVQPKRDPRFDRLTQRELEVATLVAAGFKNRQVADALFISLATVKDHVHAILTKTELRSRSEIAAAWYGRL